MIRGRCDCPDWWCPQHPEVCVLPGTMFWLKVCAVVPRLLCVEAALAFAWWIASLEEVWR